MKINKQKQRNIYFDPMSNQTGFHKTSYAMVELVLPGRVLLEVPAQVARVQLLPQHVRVIRLKEKRVKGIMWEQKVSERMG